MRIRIFDSIKAVTPGDWDQPVRRSGTPIFYRHYFLSALMGSPLQEIREARFIIFERDGIPCCSLPIFLVARASAIVTGPGGGGADTGDGVWVSHEAHWYDSHLPAVGGHDAVSDLLPGVLGSLGVRRLLLQNVADHTLLKTADARGWPTADYDTRYRLDLTEQRDHAGWLAGRGRSTRRSLRRATRRAATLGWSTEVLPSGAAELDRVVELCRRSAAKHGNPDWLPFDASLGFIRALPADRVVIHQVRVPGGGIVAAAVGFVDGTTYHSWSGGVDQSMVAGTRADANLLLYHSEIQAAFDRSCRVFEGGRRSGELKTRLGMRAVRLFSVDIPGAR